MEISNYTMDTNVDKKGKPEKFAVQLETSDF
jgi:hypothetical protein